jgi:ABC-type transport system substrate-binding protein
VGSSPQGIAVAGSGVWVAARPFTAASHRGGTLTEVTRFPPLADPVLVDADPALAAVYDGLVAFRKAGGAEGETLVPDLALRLPRPADGGTTYTFTLRLGIRYSTGALVRASDFRRGLQRQLSLAGSPDFEGIRGASACHQNPRRCDLAAGIITNDAARTVTFHLSQADPDFLYKLALLLAVPVPPGAPSRVINRAPFLPGTGPYMISQLAPNTSLALVRNPYFHQWSYAAQPAGYPNVIRIVRMTDPGKEQSMVAAGRADLVDIGSDGLPYHSLAIRYPARVHTGLPLNTWYLFLNTREPPFTSLKARQAINYAIDRDRIIQLFHGSSPGQATPTCQILPPGFPSYQPYCPYTTGAKDGAWHGPDLDKAVRLAHESGTTHVPVTVWNFMGEPVGAYLVELLRRLGYQATLHDVPFDQLFRKVSNSRNKIQMGTVGWIPDFPSPAEFFLPVLTCHSFYQDPSNTSNYGGFCDPHVDQLISEARAEQPTDPAATRRLWAQADRVVTDQAPWVPTFNRSEAWFVSARVRNCQDSPYYGGPLLDQMWVR